MLTKRPKILIDINTRNLHPKKNSGFDDFRK
jgi:hypothetical protein